MKLEEDRAHYLVEVGHHERRPDELEIKREELKVADETIYIAQTDGMNLRVRGAWGREEISLESDRAVPMQLLENIRGRAVPEQVRNQFVSRIAEFYFILARMHFPEFSPARMREPAFAGQNIVGDSGENLPIVLQQICANPERKEIVADWLSELTPMDVADFEFPSDPSGRVHLMLCEANGQKVSAYSASDGTLRFLAMLAVLLSDNQNLYFFEEIDTGIHPARQSLLLELIERQAAKRKGQLITTTHAPTLLTVMNDETFKNTSVVCRLEGSSGAIIRPISKLPSVQKLRQDQGLGRLHESGWMEDALFFTEDYDATESGS